MSDKRALKPKNIERLNELHMKHPGDLTEAERVEMEKLEKIRAKHGDVLPKK